MLKQSGFNKRAIESFGDTHKCMPDDSPNKEFNYNLSKLTNYLDQRILEEWVLPDLKKNGIQKPRILDVGAGKGRMTRYFENISDECIAIEPYSEFFDCLKASVNLNKVEIHPCTLSQYAEINKKKHDLIYISGVTPYLSDEELKVFMVTAAELLSADGFVCLRDFGAEKKEVRTQLEISRTKQNMIEYGKRAGLNCRRWRRAYPFIIFNKIHEMWPNQITKSAWELTSHRLTYPFWNLLAKLNVPRGNRRCFYVYIYERKAS